MANAGTITGHLGLDDSKFKAGVHNAGNWSKQKFAAIGGVAVAAFAANFTGSKFKEALEFTAQIQELSEQASLTTEEFQRLSYQLRQVGGNQQDVVRGLNTLDRMMAKAREGNKQAVNDFDRFGISLANITDESRLDILVRMQNVFTSINETERGGALDALRRLLGDDSARRFVAAFKEDFVGGMSQAKVITEDVIKSAKELTGELQNLNDQVLKELAQILADNKSEIKEIISFLGDAVSVTADLIKGLRVIASGSFANPLIPSKYENVEMISGAAQAIPQRQDNQRQTEYLKQMRDSLKQITDNPNRYSMSALIMGG